MKKLYILIILVCAINITNAQWIHKDLSSLTTNTFTGTSFPDSLHGWVCGRFGTIVHTSDGGNNWALQNCGVTNDIARIDFLDSLHGWAASSTGEILRTNDAGANWMHVHLSGSFIFIHFYDTLQGITANSLGVIYNTHDGGQNWVAQPGTAPSSLISIFVLDTMTAWSTISSGVLKYNGTTWSQIYTWSPEFHSIFFLDSLKGWAVGAYGLIKKTNDGGTTWTDQSIAWSGYFFSVCFTDSLNGWAVGDNGKIMKYNGSTWTNQTSNITQMLGSVNFTNNNIGWATSWGAQLVKYNPVITHANEITEDLHGISLFPNPSNDNIAIETSEKATIEILNISGQIIKTIYTADKQTSIYVSDLSGGIYFIKAKTERGVAIKKFIKE